MEYNIRDNKIILNIHDRICETEEEILSSELFEGVVTSAIKKLTKRRSILLDVFGKKDVVKEDVDHLIETLKVLKKVPAAQAVKILPTASVLLSDPARFNDFIEYLYNYWRSFDRFIISDSQGRSWDRMPYRTFNATIGQLTNLVRSMYRDIQENVTGQHPRIYRQVAAGAEVSTIAVSKDVPFKSQEYMALNSVPMMRQMLIYPPLILNPPMNKRGGRFERVMENPLKGIEFNKREWLCYPAKVGELIILIYFHHSVAELGHALCNLFEMADDADLDRAPDAVYAYGVPEAALERFGSSQIFFDDEKAGMLVGAVPLKPEFGYFGYLKKMVLTLHNVIMMKRGVLPFHGALVRIILKGDLDRTLLFIGDTGAGKSETLEALRSFGEEIIQDLIIIADDMGSIQVKDKTVLGYGTEIGAFLRLDDLQPGYALGQIDRAIIMNANQVNARIIIPVTTFDQVVKGEEIDFVFYANNYDAIDDDHPVIQRFADAESALNVFREGTSMSKGTTTSTGLTHSYFANVFGPAQYKDMHEPLAKKYFEDFFKHDVFVGQVRTRLGLAGWERKGPEEAAKELLRVIQQKV
ncbi:MAG: phosphoenolpyruvate carboxykinase [Candidatus Omnitrophica bacterium]|nr:phosphoenolpyruvate carboxykinase [Candidatus Omnitrophota bacterium]